MRRIPSPAEFLTGAAHLIGEVIRPRLSKYPQEHRPGHERTIVAIGPQGCFDGIGEEVAPEFYRRVDKAASEGRLATALEGTFNYDRKYRLHVIPSGDDDLLVYSPTNYGPRNEPTGVFEFLDAIHERVAGRARHAVMVEYGSHPDLQVPVSVLRCDGEASPGDPAIALTVANFAGHDTPDIISSLRMASFEDSVLAPTFGGAVVLYAIRDDGEAASAALATAMSEFSRKRSVIRPADETPRDVIVISLGEGRAFNAAGDSVEIEAIPAPSP